jgi:hypothetical protein
MSVEESSYQCVRDAYGLQARCYSHSGVILQCGKGVSTWTFVRPWILWKLLRTECAWRLDVCLADSSHRSPHQVGYLADSGTPASHHAPHCSCSYSRDAAENCSATTECCPRGQGRVSVFGVAEHGDDSICAHGARQSLQALCSRGQGERDSDDDDDEDEDDNLDNEEHGLMMRMMMCAIKYLCVSHLCESCESELPRSGGVCAGRVASESVHRKRPLSTRGV